MDGNLPNFSCFFTKIMFFNILDQDYKPLDLFKSKILLFGDPDFDDVDETLNPNDNKSENSGKIKNGFVFS